MTAKKATKATKATRPARKMTLEALRAAVRRYNDDNHPGWKCAGVSVRVGEVVDALNEHLLVMPVEWEKDHAAK